MSNQSYMFAFLVAGCLCLVGCWPPSEDLKVPEEPSSRNELAEEDTQPDFSSRLIEIAKEYLSYPIVDQNFEWAPVPCAPAPGPPAIEYSRSADDSSHGGKLYLMFAAKLDEYMDADKSVSQDGQIVVKESWQSVVKSDANDQPYLNHASGNQITNHATKDGQHFKQGNQKELFIMYKIDPDTPGTDQGWVYGVVAADKLSVVAQGKLTNCMECHVDAGPDRLFGPVNPKVQMGRISE